MIRRSPLSAACVVAALCLTPAIDAQILMMGSGPDGRVRLHTSDLAIFMAGDERDDLPCTVTPNEPVLGFDLQFHAGYEVSIPLREVAGRYDLLSILFRVTPESRPGEPVHFTQRIRVPKIEDDARGAAYLHGTFDLGEGRYKVDWLMRDRAGRVCSSFWDAEANLEGLLTDFPWELPGFVVVRRRRSDLVLGELPRQIADHPLFFFELETDHRALLSLACTIRRSIRLQTDLQ